MSFANTSPAELPVAGVQDWEGWAHFPTCVTCLYLVIRKNIRSFSVASKGETKFLHQRHPHTGVDLAQELRHQGPVCSRASVQKHIPDHL